VGLVAIGAAIYVFVSSAQKPAAAAQAAF
jgi:hypothetical protein